MLQFILILGDTAWWTTTLLVFPIDFCWLSRLPHLPRCSQMDTFQNWKVKHTSCVPPQLDWGLGAGRKAVTTVVSAADTHAPCTTFAQVWESKFSSPMHSSQPIGSTVWIVSCVIKLHSSFLKSRQVCRALILLIILLLLLLFNQKPTAC